MILALFDGNFFRTCVLCRYLGVIEENVRIFVDPEELWIVNPENLFSHISRFWLVEFGCNFFYYSWLLSACMNS